MVDSLGQTAREVWGTFVQGRPRSLGTRNFYSGAEQLRNEWRFEPIRYSSAVKVPDFLDLALTPTEATTITDLRGGGDETFDPRNGIPKRPRRSTVQPEVVLLADSTPVPRDADSESVLEFHDDHGGARPSAPWRIFWWSLGGICVAVLGYRIWLAMRK